MQIYDELIKDHRKVIGLLDELIEIDNTDREKKAELIGKIKDDLIPHARAEEAVLYNSIRDIQTAQQLVAHAYMEHVEAETLLRGLQAMGAVHIGWRQGVKKLKESLEHHIEEEEGTLFSASKKLFTEQEAIVMGDVFKKMKPLIQEQSMLGQSTDMLVNLMPSRLRSAFGKFMNVPVEHAS